MERWVGRVRHGTMTRVIFKKGRPCPSVVFLRVPRTYLIRLVSWDSMLSSEQMDDVCTPWRTASLEREAGPERLGSPLGCTASWYFGNRTDSRIFVSLFSHTPERSDPHRRTLAHDVRVHHPHEIDAHATPPSSVLPYTVPMMTSMIPFLSYRVRHIIINNPRYA